MIEIIEFDIDFNDFDISNSESFMRFLSSLHANIKALIKFDENIFNIIILLLIIILNCNINN